MTSEQHLKVIIKKVKVKDFSLLLIIELNTVIWSLLCYFVKVCLNLSSSSSSSSLYYVKIRAPDKVSNLSWQQSPGMTDWAHHSKVPSIPFDSGRSKKFQSESKCRHCDSVLGCTGLHNSIDKKRKKGKCMQCNNCVQILLSMHRFLKFAAN